MRTIFHTHHQIADWFEQVYEPGMRVKISTFSYYLDISGRRDYAQPYRKNGSRRIIDIVRRQDLQLLVGVPSTANGNLFRRYADTERRLKLNAKYVKNNHYKMIGVGGHALVGSINLDATTENSDAMFLGRGKTRKNALTYFDELWRNKRECAKRGWLGTPINFGKEEEFMEKRKIRLRR